MVVIITQKSIYVQFVWFRVNMCGSSYTGVGNLFVCPQCATENDF